MYRLIFQKGPQQGRRVAIRQGPVILGRHPEATLRLPEPEVALQHALLEDQPSGGVRLRRLTAGAPVRVNRQEVETVELRDGDLIEIGPHVVQFSGGAVAATAFKPTRRRLGLLQLVTLLAVGLLLIGQMIFLFVISLSPPKPTVVAIAVTNAPVSVAPTSMPQVAVATNLVVPVVTQLPPGVVSIPTATPVRVATVAPPLENNALSNELKKMQAELTQLHHEVKTLPPPKPAVITNVVAVPPPAPATNAPAPELSADDLVLAQARKMFKKTMDRVAKLDAEELDGELATIQNMAPDFLPPYIERAQRMQQRGLLADSLEQWKRVQKLATQADLKARAGEEITSLQKRLAEPPPKPKPEVREKKPEIKGHMLEAGEKKTEVSETKALVKIAMPRAKRVPAAQPVARITQVEAQKLLGGEKFDEMRLLRVTVAPVGAAPWEPAMLEIFVTFFDRGEKTGTVVPSRAVVPGAALHAAAQTVPGAPLEFSASYLVPRGFRQQELQQLGERRRYFGYRVELVSRGEVHDRRDQPANLLPAE
jgi:hypothetical protein